MKNKYLWEVYPLKSSRGGLSEIKSWSEDAWRSGIILLLRPKWFSVASHVPNILPRLSFITYQSLRDCTHIFLSHHHMRRWNIFGASNGNFFFSCSVAGTAGAVVTCPLEVVKTRLQSSNAFLPHPTDRPARHNIQSSSSSQSDALRRPEQRRKFSSTILRRIRPQVRDEKAFFDTTLDFSFFLSSSFFLLFPPAPVRDRQNYF